MDTTNPLLLSYEFFPPKSVQAENSLKRAAKQLAHLKPQFFSVTYGAGGSTQEKTTETVFTLQNENHVACAPHISCISSTSPQIREMLHHYKAHRIERLVTLRGDLPSGSGRAHGEFQYANELVTFIRDETGDHFHIEVAAYPEFHPESTDGFSDLAHFEQKVKAGANSAITQYFYNCDAYFRFIDQCEKLNLDIPIVPGIMPISNWESLLRFSQFCGAEIPRWMRGYAEVMKADKASLVAFGIEVVTKLCETLIAGGAPGLHFYTLNQAQPTKAIYHNLFGSHA